MLDKNDVFYCVIKWQQFPKIVFFGQILFVSPQVCFICQIEPLEGQIIQYLYMYINYKEILNVHLLFTYFLLYNPYINIPMTCMSDHLSELFLSASVNT